MNGMQLQFLPMAGEQTDGKPESFDTGDIVLLDDLAKEIPEQEVCCGGEPPTPGNPFERPGYAIKNYVCGFLVDERTDVALVKTKLEFIDHLGTVLARIGGWRNDYRVAPGLYGVGKPDAESPVIVTANYKLTFDSVRKELKSLSCWILVLDTCGINVWCAAGKRTFSTEEIVRQVEITGLGKKVAHRQLIVPQLGAAGVAAHEVKLKSGFRVVYGPVLARNIADFLKNEMKVSEGMRDVTFSTWERCVLIPVEFYLFSKKIWWIFPLLFVLSGIGPDLFSLKQSLEKGTQASLAVVAGGVLGAMVVPILLPWIPGRSFSLKGLLAGFLCSTAAMLAYSDVTAIEKIAIVLTVSAVSSHLALNFTGSTPYTSPSGVEKEMKIALPVQIIAVVAGSVLWLIAPFF